MNNSLKTTKNYFSGFMTSFPVNSREILYYRPWEGNNGLQWYGYQVNAMVKVVLLHILKDAQNWWIMGYEQVNIGSKCENFHPNMCPLSISKGECLDDSCTCVMSEEPDGSDLKFLRRMLRVVVTKLHLRLRRTIIYLVNWNKTIQLTQQTTLSLF